MKTGVVCTLANIIADEELRGKLTVGITVKEWLDLQKLHMEETAKVQKAFSAMSHIMQEREDVMTNGFKSLDEIFRDAAPRAIAKRILEGGTKKEIMDDIIASGLPLKTNKTPEQALVQDIPYVVRRLKQNGFDIQKDGRSYVWVKTISPTPEDIEEIRAEMEADENAEIEAQIMAEEELADELPPIEDVDWDEDDVW